MITNNRKIFTHQLNEEITVDKLLSWGKKFEPFILLNSNSESQQRADLFSSFEILIAAGSSATIPSGNNFFDSLKSFHETNHDWLFGYIGYDVKNQDEKLSSSNADGIRAEDYYFFRPEFVMEIKNNLIHIHYDPLRDDESSVKKMIYGLLNAANLIPSKKTLNVKPRINRNEYIGKVNKIKEHIQRGDIYEMNFCIEYYSENSRVDPAYLFKELNSFSPMPFSAYLHFRNIFLLCASPERFLAKRGKKIISQPIKGTAQRGKNDADDKEIISFLRNDQKEQSENVMIVDLVRNDLSRTAARGSVKVEELFGIKTFRRLHQMVSTITSEMKDGIHFSEVLRKAFPMGSMTGAPKIRAMQLIEEFENTKRGIYSGAIGYITPDGDFDFNVVIRSIILNDESGYLSFMAGSAITSGSDAEKEYEECLLKASTMKSVLGLKE